MIVTRPMGMDYIGEVEIEDGKCIHSELIYLISIPLVTR